MVIGATRRSVIRLAGPRGGRNGGESGFAQLASQIKRHILEAAKHLSSTRVNISKKSIIIGIDHKISLTEEPTNLFTVDFSLKNEAILKADILEVLEVAYGKTKLDQDELKKQLNLENVIAINEVGVKYMPEEGALEIVINGSHGIEKLEDEESPRIETPYPLSLRSRVRGLYEELGKYHIAPELDIEFYEGGDIKKLEVQGGSLQNEITLPDEAYNSTLFLTLMTAILNGKMLFLGQPSTGKTATALLIGQLFFNEPLANLRRSMIHGEPSLTRGDLIGNLKPEKLAEGKREVDPRLILTSPIKICDELPRIPSKTQNAMLTMVADGYAEVYDILFLPPNDYVDGPWYFTANAKDEGTYRILPPLLDRIEVAAKTISFNTTYLRDLSTDNGLTVQTPPHLRLSLDDIQRIRTEVDALELSEDVDEAISTVKAHLSNCQRASTNIEYMVKNTLLAQEILPTTVCGDCSLTPSEVVCAQTENGLEPRTLKAIKRYIRSLAWFRGNSNVALEDTRQLFPFKVQHKLVPSNAHAFSRPEDMVYRSDRVTWAREKLFDKALKLEREQEEAWERMFKHNPYTWAMDAINDPKINKDKKKETIHQAMKEIMSTFTPPQRDKLIRLKKELMSL